MINEIRTYQNDANVIIQGKFRVDEPAEPVFFATGYQKYQVVGGGEFTTQFHVPIPGATVEAAFENFPMAFEAARMASDAEFQRQQQAAANKLVMPDGRPINGHKG